MEFNLLEFKECTVCVNKPGTPILCPTCLHNREVISVLKNKINKHTSDLDKVHVIDGLMWQTECEEKVMNWKEAVEYSRKLTIKGYRDWRLPTIKELSSMVNYNKVDPACSVFDCHSSRYWSGSQVARTTYHAWYVNFDYGSVYSDYKTHDYYVRCVRNV